MMSFHDTVTSAITAIQRTGVPEDSTPDLIADLQSAERAIRDFRRGLEDEVTGPIEGETYRMRAKRSATRSYNMSGLLIEFGQDGEAPGQTLHRLIRAGVVRVSWQWTQLQRLADALNVTLTVAKHEVDDGDDALIGEVWSEKWEPVPK